jgi:hypothetical protein
MLVRSPARLKAHIYAVHAHAADRIVDVGAVAGNAHFQSERIRARYAQSIRGVSSSPAGGIIARAVFSSPPHSVQTISGMISGTM